MQSQSVDPYRMRFRPYADVSTRPVLDGVVLRDFFGRIDHAEPKSERIEGPQAFHVDVGAGFVDKPHFHDVDQFQLFFGGPGSFFQRSPIPEVMAQYADAYATYGPFGSGDEGFQFYTLRSQASGLRAFMPDERDKLIHRGQRQRRFDLEPWLRRASPTTSTIETIWEEPDGVGIYWIELAPGESVAGPPARGTGQYHCVLSGTVTACGTSLGPRSLGWVPARAEPIAAELLSESDEPSKVLVLQLPRPTFDRDAER